MSGKQTKTPTSDVAKAAEQTSSNPSYQSNAGAQGNTKQAAGSSTPVLDAAGLQGNDVWPMLLDTGTSTTDISTGTAGKYGFKTGRLYSLEMSVNTLSTGTQGGFKPSVGLTDLGPETKDVFEGGGANLRGPGSTSFVLDAERDKVGTVTKQSKFQATAANNGLLNILRLGSAHRQAYQAAVGSQNAQEAKLKTIKGTTTVAQGPKGRRNVIAARLTTGQDPKKADARQEDSYQKGSGDRYAKAVFGDAPVGRFAAAILKDAGAPETAIKTQTSNVLAGHKLGLDVTLQKIKEQLVASPDWFYVGKSLDLSKAAAGVSATYNPKDISKTAASVRDAYNILHKNLKDVLLPQITLPSVSTSANSAGDKSFEAVRKVLVASVKADIEGMGTPDAFKSAHAILTNVQYDGAPSSEPVNKPAMKLQEVNNEGLVGGSRKRG